MLSSDAEIHVRSQCWHCKGVGIIENPVWKRYWEWRGDAPSCLEQVGRDSNWWLEQGYQYCPSLSIDKRPPEEIDCPECDGTGYIESWVPASLFRPAEVV